MTKRGTRVSEGVVSGTTIATTPSGVTLDQAGICYDGTTYVTPTELGKLDAIDGYPMGYATAGTQVIGATIAWAGASIVVTHGFTTLVAFTTQYWDKQGGTSIRATAITESSRTSSVSVAAYTVTAGGLGLLAASGGSISWIAVGT